MRTHRGRLASRLNVASVIDSGVKSREVRIEFLVLAWIVEGPQWDQRRDAFGRSVCNH